MYYTKIASCILFVFWSVLPVGAQPFHGVEKPVKQPNLLIIMTDQQAADAMSSRGNKFVHTPNMDYLAARGVSYTHAYSANPLCAPSRSSMFTGRYPHQTGNQSNELRFVDPAEFPCLGTVFQDAGYETGYVGKWHLPYDKLNIASHGFQYTAHLKSNGIDSLLPGAAAEFLNQSRAHPFLLVVSFCNPHNICEWARGDPLPDGDVGRPASADECPPLPFNYAPSTNESAIMEMLRRSYQASWMFPVGDFSADKWREYRWAYYRMVEKVDAEIGKIIHTLQIIDNDRETVVVFLSDHGDSQGAHGWNQKTVFYEESVRVPLIVCKLGSADAVQDREQTNQQLINTGTDLLPTLCDIAGIPSPSGLPGHSFLDGVNDTVEDPFIVVSNKLVQGEAIDGYKPEPEGRMVRTNRYKYWILVDGNRHGESLYDLKTDPGETVNLASDSTYKPILLAHRRHLAAWCKRYGDHFPYLTDFH